MARVSVPRQHDDELEDLESVKIPSDDLESIMAQFDWDTGDFTAQIFREAPQEYMGKSCGGYVCTLKEKFNIEWLQKKFGGRRYKVMIRGNEGRIVKTVPNVKIAGDPRISPGDAHYNQYHTTDEKKADRSNGDTQTAPATAPGPDISPLVDRIVDRETNRAEEAERRSREYERRLLLGSQNRDDDRALSAIRESSRDTIEAHKMALEAANNRSMAAEERMSSLLQTMLKNRDSNSPKDNSEIYVQMIGAFKEEARMARDEHGHQLKALQEQAREQIRSTQEQARDQIKQSESTSRLLLEGVKTQYDSQMATLKESFGSQLRSLEDQLRRTRDELQSARDESTRLRDDLQTARHTALEAKISSQNELGNLSNIETSLTKAKSLLALLGNSEKGEEQSKLDKTLSFLGSGAPERLIGSLATRIGGIKQKEETPNYIPPIDANSMAWSSWRQNQNAPMRPELAAPATPAASPVASPAQVEVPQPARQFMPEPKRTDEAPPSDEIALLRALARKVEKASSAGTQSASDFAEELYDEAEDFGYAHLLTELTSDQVLTGFESADVELTLGARVYLREVLDSLKKYKSK